MIDSRRKKHIGSREGIGSPVGRPFLSYILLYFIFFLGHGIYFSTLGPSLLDRFGPDAGWFFMAGQLGYPVGFFLAGYISDRTRILRNFLLGSLLLHGPVQFLLYSPIESREILLLVAMGTRFLFAINFQLIGITVLEGMGVVQFGRVRAWGTVGFFFIHLVLTGLTFLEGIYLPDHFLDARRAGQIGSLLHLLTLIPAWYVQKERKSAEVYRFRDALTTIRDRGLVSFFLISFLFFFSFQVVDFYLGAYLESAGGVRGIYLGWAIAVLLEIPFLRFASRWHESHRNSILLFFLISLGAGLLRFSWLLMAAPGGNLYWILPSQILHGLHFTGYYLGAIFLLRKRVPDHLYGTAYGIYISLSAALGGAAGSALYGRLLYHTKIWLSGVDLPERGGVLLPFQNHPILALFLLSGIIHFLLFFTFIFTFRGRNGFQ